MGFLKPLCFLLFFLSTFTNGDVVSDVLSSMDQTVDRCQDFYQYACGGWIKNQTLAPDQSVVTKSFTSIEKINDEVLQAIINDSSHIHVHSFFQACMNVALINSRGIAPIQPYLGLVNSIQSATDFARVVAVLHQIGFSTLFGFTVDIDPKNPPINIIQIQQGGLGLPDQSLYSVPSLVDSYQTHISNMMMLVGLDPSTSQQIALSVVQFETALASFTVPNNNMTDPFGLYNPVDSTGLKSLCPSFDWHTYLMQLTGNDTYGTINVITPTFFSFLSPFLFNSSPLTLRNYLLWAVVHNAATLLTEKIGDENFAFYGKILGGLDKQPPRWRACEQAVDGDLGDLLGVYFAKKAFGGESKDVAAKMVAAIEQAMTNRLQTISWMDDQTRAEGLKKISLVGNYIGYPDHLRNISFEITDDYFSNVEKSALITTQQSVQKIGQAADKALWSMTADTINAYYDPTRNQMVFPAAILQSPYFDISRPAPLNFGGAGVIMGHELTHGFDNSGRDYDGYGKLRDWWQPDTSKQFDSRVQCVIDQYSKYEVLPGVFIDGKLTQGENVADMGGVKNSYDAYMSLYGPVANQPSVVPGLTNAQLLFVGYAQGWCALARPEYLRNQVKTDPHSWARFRVIGPLVNFPEFAQTFSCPAGSPMNPIDRCTVW